MPARGAGRSLGDQVPALQGGQIASPRLAEVLDRTRSAPTPSTRRFSCSDHLDYGDYAEVAAACRELGIVFFATPFDFRRGRGPGGDRRPPLQDRERRHHRPAAAGGRRGDRQADAALDRSGDARGDPPAIEWTGLGPDRLVPLVCTLTYPTPDEDANFARLETFRREFAPYLCGVSDHTLGPAGALDDGSARRRVHREALHAGQAAGRGPGSRDQRRSHGAGRDGARLQQGVGASRYELDRGPRQRTPARENARRSLVLARAVPAGNQLRSEDLGFRRPGTGIPPFEVDQMVGRRARRDLVEGTVLSESDVE